MISLKLPKRKGSKLGNELTNFSINICRADPGSRLPGHKRKPIILAGEMRYPHSDSAANAKTSGYKRPRASGKLKLVGRASPEGFPGPGVLVFLPSRKAAEGRYPF